MSRDDNDARQRVPHAVMIKTWIRGVEKTVRTERCTDPECDYTDAHTRYEERG